MPKTCRVAFTDHDTIAHSVEVQADSVFEAVVLATGVFTHSAFVPSIGTGATLTVEVREPSTSHDVPFTKVLRWLEQPGRTPAEITTKKRLNAVLDINRQPRK